MRCLVTGGAGYIGATTVRVLLERGHDVEVVDDLSNGHRDALPAQVALHEVDLLDRPRLREVVAQAAPEACIHFAGAIEAGESQRAPERYFAVNTGGSANLLDALRDAEVDRIVFSSTAAVYGEPRQVPIGEDHVLAPTNAYGESKLLVERMLRWSHELSGTRVAVLRYFNAAGAVDGLPERHDPETHLIPLALQVAAGERDRLRIFGTDYPTPDGTAVRDFVHVADLAEAHALALEALGDQPWLRCNLGTGQGYSVREVVDTVARVTGRAVPTVDEPRRAGDPAVLVAAPQEAHRLLGWRPVRSDLDRLIVDAWRDRPDDHPATPGAALRSGRPGPRGTS